jgi:hypothetical protein
MILTQQFLEFQINFKNMKKIIFLVSLVFIISCKKSNSKELNPVVKNKVAYSEKTIINDSTIQVKNLTCEEIINKIVKTSNLNTRNQNNYYTQIDRIEGDNITIHVYFENNLSDDPKNNQMVESTIAWLLFNPNDGKLYNTTSDPDNPIELNFDKRILDKNKVFEACKIIHKEKDILSIKTDIKFCVLPIDFDEYYSSCVNPYDSIKCKKNYPKYSYDEREDFAKTIGDKYHPNEYMYLPKLDNYQPIILCNTDSDTESYDLIIVNNNKIISSLEIGLMDGQFITQFNIAKDYTINLYKKKNSSEKNKKWKSYKINPDGIISELK